MADTTRTFQACARLELASRIRKHYAELEHWDGGAQLPIAYSPMYNVTLFGLEKLHPFDSAKYAKVKRKLEQEGLLTDAQLVAPAEATPEMLRDVHTQEYVNALFKGKRKLQEVTEAPLLCLVPNFLLQARLHKPMRFHVGGTMLAAALALERGWSINLGGGMHHAYSQNGGGWCVYDDWMLAMRKLRKASDNIIKKFLYVDLDVHQGNGVARDKMQFQDADLYILDMYNHEIWPGDVAAKNGIDCEATFACGCKDSEYLAKLQSGLQQAFSRFTPDFLLYNAGTDILQGDPLGLCQVSASAVIKRDQMVWQAALDHSIPICMALSGGYAKGSAGVISQCLGHLIRQFSLARGS